MIFNLLAAFDREDMNIGYVAINYPNLNHLKKLKDLNVRLYVLPRNLSNSLRYIVQLSKIAKEYDVVHVHGNSATMLLEMMAAKLAGVSLRIAHSHSVSCLHKKFDKAARPLFHLLCNGRLACSHNAGRWLFGNKEFKVINNGIETSKFTFNRAKREEIRGELGIKNEFVIGNIANFIPEKNHIFLLRIFSSLLKTHPNTKLLLLGDGPLKERFEKEARSLNVADKIMMPGCVNNPYDYINAIDLIVMPSLFEGLPLSLLEAQSNGLNAVISSTISKEVNITGNIYFIPLDAPIEKWINTIIEMLHQTEKRTKSKSHYCIDKILASGYDISQSAATLKSYYMSNLKY